LDESALSEQFTVAAKNKLYKKIKKDSRMLHRINTIKLVWGTRALAERAEFAVKKEIFLCRQCRGYVNEPSVATTGTLGETGQQRQKRQLLLD
jgi:hypothetical protein